MGRGVEGAGDLQHLGWAGSLRCSRPRPEAGRELVSTHSLLITPSA